MITLNRATKVTTSLFIDWDEIPMDDLVTELQEFGVDLPMLNSEAEFSKFLSAQDEQALSAIFDCLFNYCSKEESFSDDSDYWIS